MHFSGLKGPSSQPGGAIGPMTVSPPDVCAMDQLKVPQDSSSEGESIIPFVLLGRSPQGEETACLWIPSRGTKNKTEVTTGLTMANFVLVA